MSRESLHLIKAAVVAVAFSIASASAPAFAAGGGGGGGGGSTADQPVVCKAPLAYDSDKQACAPCKTGTVYDASKKMCVAKNSELLNDETLYKVGHDLALAGYYQDALDTLGAIRNKNDAMVLTMIGYSTRKLGHTDEGIAIYHQALAIDPNNVNTHEYLGEGYLASGRVDLAELELDTLQKLCGTTCEQYQDLQKALAGPAWN